ncbi:MAG: CRISPR-associated helicase Cas3' [Ktedonobacteraceae bacterium]|nr:CRISPR-associated helicase Cas3' [Ktedonobacteraceae bacterium]
MKSIAHTKNAEGKRQDLEEHLRNVADATGQYCASFGGEIFGRYAGLLHDIGKYDPAFQQYLLNAEQNPAKRLRGPDHKGAGTVLAQMAEAGGSLAFLINGHHGGLAARSDLKTNIKERMVNNAVQDAIATAKRTLPELQAIVHDLIPTHIRTELERELFVRMAFSALVDADFLDTEQHFNAGKSPERDNHWHISGLWERFATSYRQSFADVPQSNLNTIRAEVYQYCLNAADLAPGFFRLTVPTGGGKTLASLAFALQHALKYDRERIIYAIPYTSIIDQTAGVFRGIFADEQACIEHHSDIAMQDPQYPTPAEIQRRLAAENWDASLIVTTTVQLFESLLGCNTGKCRKLHNIARSVIVLDEVQMLPVHLLTTILDVLRQLVAYYGVTVVLCTATQPDFESRQGFEGLPDIREIVPAPERYFARLQRVEYQLPLAGETWTWEQVAARVQEEQQILVIVNTRRDAAQLLDLLTPDDTIEQEEDPALFHLSTRLCGAHRREVLQEVRLRLRTGEPCRLIATQVIEAGVDVDFPLVMRAIGPLDRIVQAAGRANREGRMPHPGTVIVFAPEDGHIPKGSYTLGTDIAKGLLRDGQANLHDPNIYQAYFRDYYSYPNRDPEDIEGTRKRFDYPLVAEKFRMIEDDSMPVVVKYASPESEDEHAVENLFNKIRSSSHREYLRALQPYTVNLLAYEFKKAQDNKLVQEVIPGVWEWLGRYDSGRDGKHGQGIVLDSTLSTQSYVW